MDIKQFYDVNKRTQTEQVLKNQEDIDALKNKDTDIEQSIDDEANARVKADESLAYDIAELQNQIEGLGNVFTLKGSVATYNDLPVTDNHIGDVWYVEANAVGYVWIDDNGTKRWEQLGLPIDLSDYVTTSDLALALEDYQEKLTAGTNISIIDNVISASGGISSVKSENVDSESATSGQVLTANGNGGASWQNAGGKKLYCHNIVITTTSNNMSTQIITDTNTAFTGTSLATFLNTNGLTSDTKFLGMANGMQIVNGSTINIFFGIYASGTTNINTIRSQTSLTYNSGTGTISISISKEKGAWEATSVTVYDTVREI